MKRIEFIAPVEAMRGNLSGAQRLEYPTDNQGAYESVQGNVNYATNYGARFIGAKVARTGKKYFAVRTKSANHLTAKSKKAMALMGGTGAMVGYILGHKSSTLYINLLAMYNKVVELGDTRTFRKYLSDHVRAGLIAKSATIVVSGPLSPVSIDNPWNTTQATPNVQVSNAILVKFWDQLAADGYTFKIGELVGVAHRQDIFNVIVDRSYNVLGLTIAQGTDTNIVKLGSQFVNFHYGGSDYTAGSGDEPGFVDSGQTPIGDYVLGSTEHSTYND